MMRLPLPVIFAALVVVAAGSVLLNVHVKSDAYVINATALGPGQNVTITLDHIPTRILVLGNSSSLYSVTVRADATFAAPSGEVYSGVYRAVIRGGETVEIRVVDVRDPRAEIVVRALP
jgi:hypothetical protein